MRRAIFQLVSPYEDIEPAQPSAPSAVDDDLDDADRHDPRWDAAIDLLLVGATHKLVAERVGVHRNTITNWLKDPDFRVELARRSDEQTAAAKQRLAVVTTHLVDRLAWLANHAIEAAERNLTDRRAQRAARDWLRKYRQLARVEAEILGPVVHPAYR